MTDTKQSPRERKFAKKAEVLNKVINRRLTREIAEYFDKDLDELNGIEWTMVYAHLVDKSRTFEDLEEVGLGELEDIVIGE